MNLLRVKKVGGGMHPSETVVEVATKTGPEQLSVFPDEIQEDKFVRIGFPVDSSQGHHLVELPSETARGSWRVWVKREDVIERPGRDTHGS